MKIIKSKDRSYNWEVETHACRIHWSSTMLCMLRKYFATTKNEELAGMLGVSVRSLIRKARELGITKDESWLKQMWSAYVRLAHLHSRSLGYPGAFRKGESPKAGQFKPGRVESEESKAKRIASLKDWYRRNRKAASEKSKKAWETRRLNKAKKQN